MKFMAVLKFNSEVCSWMFRLGSLIVLGVNFGSAICYIPDWAGCMNP